MKFDPKIQQGDILLMRAFDWFGFIVHLIFPPSPLKWPSGIKTAWPSVHNGILGIYNSKEGVFEARIKERFHFTPWEYYEKKLKQKKIEVKIVRLSLPKDLLIDISKHVNKDVKLKYKYDVMGVLSMALNHFFNIQWFKRHSYHGWYCTEAVAHVFNKEGVKLFSDKLPSPYEIEKMTRDGQLVEVSDYF